jgi:hypothetical protein
MRNVTLETIHKDIASLKKEIREIKVILIQEPELAEDVVKRINKARQRMKSGFVSHKEVKKEFAE